MVTFGKLGLHGRFGNQLFQVASTIGIARKRGYEVAFPQWVNHDAANRFGAKEDVNVHEWFPNWKHYKRCNPEGMYEYYIHWGWHGFEFPDGVSILGHMQSELYFEHCADEIRGLFTMKGEPDRISYTAVHIRMGDYGGSYHPICSFDYYEQAFRVVKGPYMVFSDEPQKAWEMLKPLLGPSDILFHGDTRYSFSRMKKCKSHIIANSTFSWWAAWLAGDEVVAPRQWFGPDAAYLDTTHLYPKTWTVV
jgi:hypothetical protein